MEFLVDVVCGCDEAVCLFEEAVMVLEDFAVEVEEAFFKPLHGVVVDCGEVGGDVFGEHCVNNVDDVWVYSG